MAVMKGYVCPLSTASLVEWVKKCTIAKCIPTAADELAVFGRERLRKYLSLFDQNLAEEHCGSGVPQRAWLELEAYLYAGRNPEIQERDGKRYKDMILSQPKPLGYLTCICRTVAGKIAADELPGARLVDGTLSTAVQFVSADKKDENGLTLIDRLTGESYVNSANANKSAEDNEPADNDDIEVTSDATLILSTSALVEPATEDDADKTQSIVARQAEAFWNELDETNRLLMLCLIHGHVNILALSRSGLFPCGNSALSRRFNALPGTIAQVVGGESRLHTAYLSRAILPELVKIAGKWLDAHKNAVAIRLYLYDNIEN
jgi:hypothetical protein